MRVSQPSRHTSSSTTCFSSPPVLLLFRVLTDCVLIDHELPGSTARCRLSAAGHRVPSAAGALRRAAAAGVPDDAGRRQRVPAAEARDHEPRRRLLERMLRRPLLLLRPRHVLLMSTVRLQAAAPSPLSVVAAAAAADDAVLCSPRVTCSWSLFLLWVGLSSYRGSIVLFLRW